MLPNPMPKEIPKTHHIKPGKVLLTPGTKVPSGPKQMEHKELQEMLEEDMAINDQELTACQGEASANMQEGRQCNDPELVQARTKLQEQAKKVQQLNKRLNNL